MEKKLILFVRFAKDRIKTRKTKVRKDVLKQENSGEEKRSGLLLSAIAPNFTNLI